MAYTCKLFFERTSVHLTVEKTMARYQTFTKRLLLKQKELQVKAFPNLKFTPRQYYLRQSNDIATSHH